MSNTWEIILKRKMIVYKYDTFFVEAKSRDEAINLAKKTWCDEKFDLDNDLEYYDGDLEWDEKDYINETLVEPDSEATATLYIENGFEREVIIDNIPLHIKREDKINKILNE